MSSTYEPGTVQVDADLWALIKSPAGKIALRIVESDRGFTSRCWITDYCINGGYATVKFDGKMRKAHRVTYEAIIGEIPPGLVLDHLCRVRECVNPRHLDPVTQRVNSLRGDGPTAINAKAESCTKGHPFTPANTMRRSDGGRRCRACNLIHQRNYNATRSAS
jgi:hypothetical protein